MRADYYHDGTAATTKEKYEGCGTADKRGYYYWRLSAFIGGFNISLHSLVGVLGGCLFEFAVLQGGEDEACQFRDLRGFLLRLSET
jgi:hypothetical protein